MSVEKLKEFIEKYKEDEEFRKAINNAPDVNAKRRIAREAGFEFTREEVEKYFNLNTMELTDEALEKVVGGTNALIYLDEEIKAALDSSL